MKQAFTLIELLIVVLIIAILAAIAVPNFLEFQTRAKVSRALADLRSASIGVKAYVIDNGDAMIAWDDHFDPPGWAGYTAWPQSIANEIPGTIIDAKNCPLESNRLHHRTIVAWLSLTTPISYLTTAFYDPFSLGLPYEVNVPRNAGEMRIVLMSAIGPDRLMGNYQNIGVPTYLSGMNADLCGDFHPPYDPTNGTVSNGDVYRISAVQDYKFAHDRFDSFLNEIYK